MDSITPFTPTRTASPIAALSPAALTPVGDAPQEAIIPLSSTSVDLSPLGQFMSSMALSQKRFTELQADATGEAAGLERFDQAASAVQGLLDGFRSLQTSGAANPALRLESPQAVSLSQRFSQALGLQGDSSDNTDAALAPLAEIGITFQPAVQAGDVGTLLVDQPALRAAFEADPHGTLSALQQGSDQFGAIAAEYAQRAAGLAPADANGTSVTPEAEDVDAKTGPAPNQSTGNIDQNDAEINAETAQRQTALADMALGELLSTNTSPVQTREPPKPPTPPTDPADNPPPPPADRIPAAGSAALPLLDPSNDLADLSVDDPRLLIATPEETAIAAQQLQRNVERNNLLNATAEETALAAQQLQRNLEQANLARANEQELTRIAQRDQQRADQAVSDTNTEEQLRSQQRLIERSTELANTQLRNDQTRLESTRNLDASTTLRDAELRLQEQERNLAAATQARDQAAQALTRLREQGQLEQNQQDEVSILRSQQAMTEQQRNVASREQLTRQNEADRLDDTEAATIEQRRVANQRESQATDDAGLTGDVTTARAASPLVNQVAMNADMAGTTLEQNTMALAAGVNPNANINEALARARRLQADAASAAEPDANRPDSEADRRAVQAPATQPPSPDALARSRTEQERLLARDPATAAAIAAYHMNEGQFKGLANERQNTPPSQAPTVPPVESVTRVLPIEAIDGGSDAGGMQPRQR